ncbi:MAG: hypothetical protein HKO01_11300 [Flaviramulus sp.]|nr:hypothetical protein [Flaviramulus sp.]NNC51111.1 hypothetical protein [Flaviramulus sp.]
MGNEIVYDNVKFWLDHHVIHCRIKNNINEEFSKIEFEDLFIKIISTLTYGNYKPVLIDLTDLSYLNALSVFKTISRSIRIKSTVLSKTFLVQSIDLKLLLSLYNFGNDSVVPNKISTNYNVALKYSNETYEQFNASY